MSTVESHAKLIQGAKRLRADWQAAKEAWQDENCRQFDRKFMSPLESSIRAAALALERMENLLETAQRDCSDRAGYDP